MSLLWERSPPAQAGDSFRHCLSEVRRAAPGLILKEGRTVYLARNASVQLSPTESRQGPGADGLLNVLDLPSFGKSFDDWLKSQRAKIAQEALPFDTRPGITELQFNSNLHADIPTSFSPVNSHPLMPLLVVTARVSNPGDEYLFQLASDVADAAARFRELSVVHHEGHIDQSTAINRLFYLMELIPRSETLIQFRLTRRPENVVLWSEIVQLGMAGPLPDSSAMKIVSQTLGLAIPIVEQDILSYDLIANQRYTIFLNLAHSSRIPSTFDHAKSIAGQLEEFMAVEPRFVPPALMLARMYNTDYVYTRAGSSGVTERDRAMALTRRAAEIDPLQSQVWTRMGWCHLWRAEWDQAAQCFSKAHSLNPHHADRLIEIGFGWVQLGDLAKADQALERARELMLVPSQFYWSDRALLDCFLGEPMKAVEAANLAGEDYVFSMIHGLIARTLAGVETRDVATRLKARLATMFPGGKAPDFDTLTFWLRRSGMPFRKKSMMDLVLDALKTGYGPR